MTDIEELIESANRLCKSLEEAAENEKQFSYNICYELEKLANNTKKMANDLKYLQ